MKITVLFPTATEAQFFADSRVDVAICGVGHSAAAANTLRVIMRAQPDCLILAGIAGVYPVSALQLGEVALVQSECEADLGFFTPQGFMQLADLPLEMDFIRMPRWVSPHQPPQPRWPLAHSNSLNAAMAPFVKTSGVDLENMEGAAFFQVCLAEQVRFFELRAVSNPVAISDEAWDFAGSIQALTGAVTQLVDDLLAEAGQ
ncbi:phosphorylase family protein [Chitinibacter tainanensis]|uniref:phosphorylase family protein n=1 Tax=Chitinibacter tainanensis TaxID=230667 RepID=UPI00041FC4ED|nr:purine phosphorylase [Chitinibacter tainanensis]